MPSGGVAGASAVTDCGRLLPDLRSLGLRSGDLVMVHASLRRLGLAANGGAERLLDALDAAVGAEGTLLMLLGTHYEQDWVNERPEAERGALLEGTEPFDPVTALANRDVGWLAEAFRRRSGTIVTGNPSGRFGARGRDSAALLDGAPWHDYYGPGSPLERLCERGGRILRLGADPDTVTALHYAEYLARLPSKRRVRWQYLVRGEDGPERVHTACLDDSQGIAAWEGDDYFKLILSDYLAAGRARTGQVGAAQSELIEAADMVEFGALWMERHLT